MVKLISNSPELTHTLDLPPGLLRHHSQTLLGPMREWKNRIQVPPVLLLTGQAGIGKRSMSYFLARWILCEQTGLPSSDGFSPCEVCSSCKKIQAGNSVDLTEIVSDSEDSSESSSGTLKIDQFRKMKAAGGYGAHESKYRIHLIPYADRMTPQAANSVLKLLEDTPAGWLFFLTTVDVTLLLPTLVSRCQVLRLKPFPVEEIEKELRSSGVPEDRVPIAAALSQGSWNRALKYCSDEIWEQRKNIFQILEDPASVFLSLIDWASQESNHFEILVDLLEQFTAELIRWSGTPEAKPESYPWVHSDGKNSYCFHIKNTLQKFGDIRAARSFWISRAERLAQVRQESLAPLNRKILVQDLLLPWLGVEK